jgi:hypothetical protein
LAAKEEAEKDFRDTVAMAEATGGVIEGGTWEHRKRAKEMLKTAEGALEVTLANAGRYIHTHTHKYIHMCVCMCI